MALRVLILSDGRPGHYHLSEGIGAALGRLAPVTIETVQVRRGRWPGIVAAAMSWVPQASRAAFGNIYGSDPEALPEADVLVSAGAETLAASVMLARLRGLVNIHYGSLRHFRPTDFSLVLTSYPDRGSRPRHAFTMKPAGFDPDALGPPADPARWTGALGGGLGGGWPATIGVAIGGPAGGCVFTSADWDGLLKVMRHAAEQHSVRWVVSNSRRTPEDVSERLAAAARDPRTGIDRFADVRLPGAPRLWDLFRPAEAILVTADSSSMLSEAVFARRAVLALAPGKLALTREEQSYRDALAAQGWTRSIPMQGLVASELRSALAAVRPMHRNPLDDLAALIAERLPQLRREFEA